MIIFPKRMVKIMIKRNLEITTNQFICMIVGYSIVASQLKYPAIMNSFAAQDGWIITILSGIYPILFFYLYSVVYKEYPDKDILDINKTLLGKFIGTIFNIIFALSLLGYSIREFSGFSILLMNTLLAYYTNSQIIFIILIASSIATFFSFRAALKLSQLSLYLTVLLILILGITLKDGSILNIMPIFSIEPKDIIKSTYHGIYAYSGFEIMLLYFPYLKNKRDYKKIAISTCLLLILIVSWLVFLAIFYFGPDTLNLFYFPLLNLTAFINIPVVNNFIIIFVTLWSIHEFKNSTLSISNLLHILPPDKDSNYKKLWLIIILPFLYFSISSLSNISNIIFFINKILINIMLLVLFNIFILFIVILRRKAYENKKDNTFKNH